MRKLIKSAPIQKQFHRNVAAEYRPEKNDEVLRNWTSRLTNLSSQPASRGYLSQFQALLAYYNKQVNDTTKEIDWSDWQNRITTKGLVGKVQANFQELNSQEYDLDKIFSDIFSRESKAIETINSEMAFHTTVWIDNYAQYITFLLDISSVSNLNDYSTMELMDMYPGVTTHADALDETHNYLPGAKDDVNLIMYMANQFAWGKKMVTFYRHPSDDNMGARATKNTMGR